MCTWGWAVQVYAARSRASWGIGDLADLRTLGQWSAERGAGFALLNPLHAVAPTIPQQANPYYPSSRCFRNPLYLRIEEVPGADALGGELERLAAAGHDLNHTETLDRDAVFRLKIAALERIWRDWQELREEDETRMHRSFEAFCAEGGTALEAFATHCTLAERFGPSWQEWPPPYRRGSSSEVATFAEQNRSRVRFHQWLQWLIDDQLERVAHTLPLINDIAVGVDAHGADSWQWEDAFVAGFSIGAPPDAFNALGQDWGVVPPHPAQLGALRYEPLRAMLRSGFRHAAGVRVDHIMGLFRLFWIPEGAPPSAGAYVRYPFEELLEVVAAESQRAQAYVVGEDLGTVEGIVREEMAARDILSYRLMYFEKDRPECYPQRSLAAVTTHDLPTIAGLWSGSDLEALRRVGLGANEAESLAIRERLAALTGAEPAWNPEQAVAAAYEQLSRSPSMLLAASLDDAAGSVERPNMPGATAEQWPSWRLPLPSPLEDVLSGSLAGDIARALRR